MHPLLDPDHLATQMPHIVEALEAEGYYVLRSFISCEQTEKMRKISELMLQRVPWLPGKTYQPGVTPDYALNWLYSQDKTQLASVRLMMYQHNEQDPVLREVIDVVTGLKDELDKHWPETIAFYRKQKMASMCIVSRYENEAGYYPQHKDAPGDLNNPLPQMQMLLSEPGVDFQNGDLVLHFENGETLSSSELALCPGDLFIFDKRITHSVDQVLAGETEIGRWMALFGVSVKRPD